MFDQTADQFIVVHQEDNFNMQPFTFEEGRLWTTELPSGINSQYIEYILAYISAICSDQEECLMKGRADISIDRENTHAIKEALKYHEFF